MPVELEIVPMELSDANAFVMHHHRHHGAVVGHKFSIGLSRADEIVGVAIIGRPVGRLADDGWTLEVVRCCVFECRNGCSMLYRTAWRATQAIGYRKLITYTLPEETGSSLRGAGFRLIGKAGGGPFESRRYLVQSRTRPAMKHLIEMDYVPEGCTKPRPQCSCEESYLKGNECAHIRACRAYEKELLQHIKGI